MTYVYTNQPDPSREAPATLWTWADRLDRHGREVASGQREPTLSSGGERHTPADFHTLADTWRRCAMYGVLHLMDVPVMPEGPVLAPHTLRFSVEAGRFSVSDVLGSAVANRQLPTGLPDAVAALVTALDEAVSTCRFTPKARGAYAMWGDQPCTMCPAWMSRHRRPGTCGPTAARCARS